VKVKHISGVLCTGGGALVNLCSDFISRLILTKLYPSVRYGKTSNEFAFHDTASKVKVTDTIFRKSLSSP
jgi:hypothetical protein